MIRTIYTVSALVTAIHCRGLICWLVVPLCNMIQTVIIRNPIQRTQMYNYYARRIWFRVTHERQTVHVPFLTMTIKQRDHRKYYIYHKTHWGSLALYVTWCHNQEWGVIRKVKVKLSLYRQWRPVGLREVEAPTFFRHSAQRWRQGCQPYAPADFLDPEPLLFHSNSSSVILTRLSRPGFRRTTPQKIW
jgi:hypothetical protein